MSVTQDRKPKAADIADEAFLMTLLDVFEEEGGWTCTWNLRERIPGFPEKVLRAKAGQLIKRELVTGCTCGCRGDFELTPGGLTYLARSGAASKRKLQIYARARAVKWEPGPVNPS